MEELWMPIRGFEDAYEVSNLGRVRTVNGKIRKQQIARGGYLRVSLYGRDNKTYQRHVHRLVADAFIPNPHNLPQINHRDENKENNRADNLEWCSAQYNSTYGTRMERLKKSLHKPIAQYDKNGNLIAIHESLQAAAKAIGVKYVGGIGVAANRYIDKLGHHHKTAYGYVWSWANKIDVQ